MPENKERLAIFLPSLVVGGAERSMLKLASGIANRGYPVDLVLGTAVGPFIKEIPENVRLVDLRARRALTSIPSLIRYLQHEKPAALLTVMYTNFIALWARFLAHSPTRIFISERTPLSIHVNNSVFDLRIKSMPLLTRFFYRWADGIIAVSKGVAEDLAALCRLPPERISVIYNPIITPEFIRNTHDPLAHPWFDPGAPPVILAVGRLTQAKGYDTLIKAFANISQVSPARLMIIGDGEDQPQLEKLIKVLNLESKVCLSGYNPNPYPYMKRAEVFVLSSRWEGLPGVLIEALYCGPRIVSTDCPYGAREILANGSFGKLVPVGDEDALGQAILSGLAHQFLPPPPVSWQPFELDKIVDQYINVLVGS